MKTRGWTITPDLATPRNRVQSENELHDRALSFEQTSDSGVDVRFESFHEIPHVVKHPPQLFSGEEPFRILNMQRYFYGSVDMHVHFRLSKRRSEAINETGDLCAVLIEPGAGRAWDPLVASRGDEGSVPQAADYRREGPAVFVGVVEPVEEGESVDIRIRSAVVGLRCLDDCHCVLGHAVDSARPTSARVVMDAGVGALVQRWILSEDGEERISLAESDGEVVQRRADVVDNVTGDRREPIGIWLLRDPKTVQPDALLALGLDLTENLVRVACRVPIDLCLQLLEVLFRPIELETPGRLSHG
jgi:hypothetical protein